MKFSLILWTDCESDIKTIEWLASSVLTYLCFWNLRFNESPVYPTICNPVSQEIYYWLGVFLLLPSTQYTVHVMQNSASCGCRRGSRRGVQVFSRALSRGSRVPRSMGKHANRRCSAFPATRHRRVSEAGEAQRIFPSLNFSDIFLKGYERMVQNSHLTDAYYPFTQFSNLIDFYNYSTL